MKLYVMSKTRNGKLLTPKVSRDFKNLGVEMQAEYDKVLKDAGSLGDGRGLQDDGTLLAYCGEIPYVWKIDEIKC